METVVFRLLDRKVDKNSFFLNEDGTRDLERKLDFTNTYGVLNPFYIIEQGGIRKYYRYIAGCPIYDPVEQEKQKIVANIQNTLIEFKAGVDIVLDVERGGVLVEFLKIHPFNIKSPYHRPDLHDAVFYTYDPKEEQKKELDKASEEDQAIETLYSLKGDTDRLRAVAALFSETAGLSDDEDIYLGLRQLARNKPQHFNSSITSRENQILSDVLLASRIGVIGRDAKGWFFEADNSSLLATTARTQKDAEAELVTFLMSAAGEVFYRQLLVKKQQKEIELNAPAGKIDDQTKPDIDDRGQVHPKKGAKQQVQS